MPHRRLPPPSPCPDRGREPTVDALLRHNNLLHAPSLEVAGATA